LPHQQPTRRPHLLADPADNWPVVPAPHLPRYQGRPHFGKNDERIFLHPTCKLASKLPSLSLLAALQRKHDPRGLFRTDMLTKVGAFWGA